MSMKNGTKTRLPLGGWGWFGIFAAALTALVAVVGAWALLAWVVILVARAVGVSI